MISTITTSTFLMCHMIRHSAALLGINFLIDAAHAINYNAVPLLHIED